MNATSDDDDSDCYIAGFDPISDKWITAKSDPGETRPESQQQSHQQTEELQSCTACPRCGTTNKRKRCIQCSSCNRHWHLTCVRLKRAQADVLPCWWCPECIVTSGSPSQCSAGASNADPSASDPVQSPAAATTICDGGDLALRLANLKQTRPVVRRIPRGARVQAAGALATLIETALEERTETSWTRLFLFAFLALHLPSRHHASADSSTLTAKIKQQISMYMDSDSSLQRASAADEGSNRNETVHRKMERHRPAEKTGEILQRKVAAKLSDGDIQGSIRILASSDEIVQNSTDVTESLKLKHPPAPPDLNMPPPPDAGTQPYFANEAEVRATITSFDTGSSAGLDGLRPAHLKDLTSRSAGEAGVRLTAALTGLVNMALSGELPRSARAAFFGAALTALRKSDGGVRPIAVGCTYRRLAAKLALRPLRAEVGEQLRPTQLGYGTPGGCEAAAHATRAFSRSLETESVMVKMDMKNAFNTVRRDHFLRRVRESAPSIYHLLWQAYSEPTPLFYGTSEISSATGLQQGDPCGPAVFSLAVHQVASAATAPFNCWYLDDGTLGGKVSTICADLEELMLGMAKIGLDINPAKCEIILPSTATDEQRASAVGKIHLLLPRAPVVTDAELTVLGAPITGTAARAVMAKKMDEPDLLVERLHQLDAHSPFSLLRNCLAAEITIPT